MTNKCLFLFSIFMLSIFINLKAQDFIYLLNDRVIEANVKSIVGDYIQYKLPDDADGKTLRIAKTEIDHLDKADGTKVWYNRLSKPASPKKQPEKKVSNEGAKTTTRRTITAQKLLDKRTKLLHTSSYQIMSGIVIPNNTAYSFETGYALGLEYTNYYTDHIGLVGHLSGTLNEIDYSEQGRNLNGQVFNSWLMIGTKLGTGVWLNSNRLYSQFMIGGNYMVPLEGVEDINNSIHLAASVGGGIVIKDLVNLSLHYHVSNQKISAFTPTKKDMTSYLLISIGLQIH